LLSPLLLKEFDVFSASLRYDFYGYFFIRKITV